MKNKEKENLEQIKSLSKNDVDNSKVKKNQSDDDSDGSYEDVKKSYEQKGKMATKNVKENSSSSDEQEDFYSRV